MLQLEIIGNLGADAQVMTSNGKPFVSFNVAHTERWQGDDGVKHEQTQWVSCALNGDGGNLLQYLKKGTTVYAIGRVSTRVFSSEKERRMVAGLNLSINHIELVGGKTDDVPSRLVDNDGLIVPTFKAYYTTEQKYYEQELHDVSGKLYTIDKVGFITPKPEE